MFLKKTSVKLYKIVAERVFFLFFGFYLALFLLNMIAEDFVSYAFNLDVFFYTSILLAVILVGVKRFTEVNDENSDKRKRITLKKIGLLLAVSLIVLFLGSKTLSDSGATTKYMISILLGVFSFLFLLYLEREGLLFVSETDVEDDDKITKAVRLINRSTIALVGLAFFYLIYVNVVPGGVVHYSIMPQNNTRNVVLYDTGEDELVGLTTDGDQYRLAIENPVNISLRIPRRFHEIQTKVTYLPTKNNTSLRLGTKNIFDGLSYTELVNYDPDLENLPPYWQQVREGDTVVWQKNANYEKLYEEMLDKVKNLDTVYETQLGTLNTDRSEGLSQDEYEKLVTQANDAYKIKEAEITNQYESQFKSFQPQYSSVQSFIDDLHFQYTKTVGYHFPLSDYFNVDKSQSTETSYSQSRSMRGGYTLDVFLPEKASIDVSITALDTNKHAGTDPVRLVLFKGSENLQEENFEDDGIVEGNNSKTDPRTFSLASEPLESGMYKVFFDTTYDLFTTHIDVSSPFVAFNNILHVTDSLAFSDVIDQDYSLPITVYTNSSKIQFSTAHSNSLQTILINGESFPITEVQNWTEKSDLPRVSTIEIPKGDVKLRGDGVFVFNKNSQMLSYREPTYDGLASTSFTNADYIIANYPKTQQKDGWDVAEATVYAPHIGFNQNRAEFVLDFKSLGLNSETVKIKQIDVTLRKDPITISKILEKIRSLF